MPAQIYSYTKVIEPGPNGYTLYAKLPEGGLELCSIDGKTYVSIPDGADPIPDQHAEITLTPVIVDAGLRDKLLTQSRACQLISQATIDSIRAKYTIDDEMYFARIGVGAATGLYQPTETEMNELATFGAFVESVRSWARNQRLALGL